MWPKCQPGSKDELITRVHPECVQCLAEALKRNAVILVLT